MKLTVKTFGFFIFIGLWTVLLAQPLDSGDLAQALKRTMKLGSGLEQWQDLPQYPITLSNALEPTLVTSPGYYSVAWDDANLYVLGVFEQPQETLLATLPTNAPEWWTGDTLEIFVRFATDAEKLHFAMNPSGTPFVEFTSSVNYQAVSQVEETRWLLEVAIPLADVLPAVTVGDVWSFKVGRSYLATNEYSLWPNGGDFQAETNFGSLYFTTALEDPETLYTRLAPGLE
jgi:Carbohydrate family 9 binding domain-like